MGGFIEELETNNDGSDDIIDVDDDENPVSNQIFFVRSVLFI